MTAWLLTKVLCYLEHLERRGIVRRIEGEPVQWTALADSDERPGPLRGVSDAP
jgi:hypothetical protein